MSEDSPGDHRFDGASPLTREFLERLRTASVVRHLQVALIPACCQTPEYTAALLSGAYGTFGEGLGTPLEVRARYRALAGHCDVRLLVDEAALRRPVGGSAVMREQVAEIFRMVDDGTVDLRVIPLSIGAYPGLRGSFIHLAGAAGAWTYREHDSVESAVVGPEAALLAERFDLLWSHAVQGPDMRGLIEGGAR